MNFVKLKGNLVKEADLRYLGSKGTPKYTNTLAVSEEYNGKKSVSYIPIESWNELAEKMAHFKKGNEVSLIGKLVTGSYENKEGTKVYTWGVNVNKLETDTHAKNELNDIFPDAKVTDEDLPF
jgi:single-strand DNA-binding protein